MPASKQLRYAATVTSVVSMQYVERVTGCGGCSLATSVDPIVKVPPGMRCIPPGHINGRHDPATQALPSPHGDPQAPQLRRLVLKSTHPSGHTVQTRRTPASGGGVDGVHAIKAQELVWHTAPIGQTTPHAPQFARSVARSDSHPLLGRSSQSAWAASQTYPHRPPMHVAVAPATAGQTSPQAPQFVGSRSTATHAPSHRSSSAPQDAAVSGVGASTGGTVSIAGISTISASMVGVMSAARSLMIGTSRAASTLPASIAPSATTAASLPANGRTTARVAGSQRPVTPHRSSLPQVTPTHADARSSVTSSVCPTAKRTTARCATAAVAAVHPLGARHPRASIQTGVSVSSAGTMPTSSGSGRRSPPTPSAVVRALRSGPVGPPRRTVRVTLWTVRPAPHATSDSTRATSSVRGCSHPATSNTHPAAAAARRIGRQYQRVDRAVDGRGPAATTGDRSAPEAPLDRSSAW